MYDSNAVTLKSKKKRKGITILGISLTAVFITAFILIQTIEWKHSISAEEFTQKAIKLGYSVSDKERNTHTANIIETDTFYLEFSEFEDNGSTASAYNRYTADARKYFDENYASNRISTSSSSFGKYKILKIYNNKGIVITERINKTTMFAYCKAENFKELSKILSAIGY